MPRDRPVSIAQHTKIISVGGATIDLAGKIHFTVPAGALSAPTRICVAVEHHQDDGLVVHFSPHGQVFRYPAELTIPQTFWKELSHDSPINVYYRAHPSRRWQFAPFATWSKTSEVVHIQIPHFSSYYFIRRYLSP